MQALKRLLPVWLLIGAAAAVPAAAPAPTPLAARDDEPSLDPWVTVNESGQPRTVTPVLTTISGTPTVISAAPYELTGTVFTRTDNGDVRTSTGTAAPLPTATNVVGAGVFDVCRNKDGDFKPFCMPSDNATLYTGAVYYVTWDPTFFNGSNTTVQVQGFVHNITTNEITLDPAFPSSPMPAGWGFYQWALDDNLLSSRGLNAVNVTLRMAVLNGPAQWYDGPRVLVSYKPIYRQPPAQAPTGPALYIGLPTVLGFVAVILVGTCIWNRKSRKIGLGNIMSRSRHGYGAGKSRAARMMGSRSRRNKEQGIRLMERDVGGLPEHEVYRDVPETRRKQAERHVEPLDVGIARRDSDALGSLAGTPTEERHMDLGRPGKGNVFRDELSRQNIERR
ncbi:hypothetical protein GQ53DRAFT_302783 [Thozetella sp. PMI_491]|nr:hypothetical protein GQ53DRAFT_302783 [Thozetella sp. PMI_491]